MSAIGEPDVGVLLPHIEAHVEGFRGPMQVKKFSDGQSNPTFHIAAQSEGYV